MVDGIACPRVAEYNDRITEKEKDAPMYVGLREQAHGMHPPINMVIVSKYELVEKSPGVFC